MHAAGHGFNILSQAEMQRLHQNVLRLLAEMGMEIQNAALLTRMADAGFPIDRARQRVTFPERRVETFLSQANRVDWDNHVPKIGASAGVYHGYFQDPASGQLLPWDEEKLAFYFSLARSLEHVGSAMMLGCRLPAPPRLEPLYERLYCWKYGAGEGGSIYLDKLCPYLWELYQMRAAETGRSPAQVFKGNVYLVPALKLGYHEAYQVNYFCERGLRVKIGGSMLTMGADAPVTLAGAVVLNLAEQMALRMLDWVLWGDAELHLQAGIAALDMRTTIRPFGRPEMAIAGLMTAQMARFYGAAYRGQAGLTDAKQPSVEAGAQKAISATATLLAGGSFWMDAGLLSIDEVCSPLQLVLDGEFLSALKRFIHPFEVDAEAIGLDTILQVGPGGHYLDSLHTVRYFRREHWNPSIWSRQMTNPWLRGDRKIDLDLAREVIAGQRQEEYRSSRLSASFETAWRKLCKRAERALA